MSKLQAPLEEALRQAEEAVESHPGVKAGVAADYYERLGRGKKECSVTGTGSHAAAATAAAASH